MLIFQRLILIHVVLIYGPRDIYKSEWLANQLGLLCLSYIVQDKERCNTILSKLLFPLDLLVAQHQ